MKVTIDRTTLKWDIYYKQAYAYVPFGVRDEKGREVGCFLVIEIETGAASPIPEDWAQESLPNGFLAYVQATRAGESFGATQYGHGCEPIATKADAIDSAVRKAEASMARVLRKAAKNGGIYK
jgi:hypothetical protein